MHPIWLRVGHLTIYWHSVLMSLGIVLGAAYAQWQSGRVLPKREPGTGHIDVRGWDAVLWALVAGLIGARAAYVIPNWADYAGHPTALFTFWGGGLVFQGGLLGGLLALWVFSLWERLPYARLLDLAAPAVALAQAFGWAGALLHGAGYGVVVRSAFSVWLPDLYGIYGPRFPTQALASLLGLLLFLALHRWSRYRLPPGMLALIYLFCNGLGHLLLEFVRADEAFFLGPLRMTQWFELVEVMVAIALLLGMWRRSVDRTRWMTAAQSERNQP